MIELRFGSKPGARVRVHLTDTEAKRLRNHLQALFPPKQVNDAAAAAMAVERARKEGTQ